MRAGVGLSMLARSACACWLSLWLPSAALADVDAVAKPAIVTRVRVPMTCTRGPSGQSYTSSVVMPAEAPTGGRMTLRIDGVPSAKLAHTGLRYIFDITTDFLLPSGASYVEHSARIVPLRSHAS